MISHVSRTTWYMTLAYLLRILRRRPYCGPTPTNTLVPTRVLETCEGRSLCARIYVWMCGSARTLGGWSKRATGTPRVSTCVPLSNQTDPAWVQVARFLSLYRMFSRISPSTGKEFCPRIVFPDVYTSREYENVGWSVFSKIGERDGDMREDKGNRFDIRDHFFPFPFLFFF